MNMIFIYNKESIEDLSILSQVSKEYPNSIKVIELSQLNGILKDSIVDTPAIIPIVESLQGIHIKGADVNGSLIALVAAKKWIEQEENVIHNLKTNRLDNFIKREKQKSIDDYTEELLIGGLL